MQVIGLLLWLPVGNRRFDLVVFSSELERAEQEEERNPTGNIAGYERHP